MGCAWDAVGGFLKVQGAWVLGFWGTGSVRLLDFGFGHLRVWGGCDRDPPD